MQKNKTQKGITLIETILYLGIAIFVMGALFSYGWNIAGISIKSSVVRETSAVAKDIGEKIAYEIRRVQSVDRGVSVFNSENAKLVLLKDGESVIFEIANGRLSLKRGSADPVFLNSENIQIENFIFTEQVSDAEETEFIGFSFDATADYSDNNQRNEYQYSLPIRSGAALRNY